MTHHKHHHAHTSINCSCGPLKCPTPILIGEGVQVQDNLALLQAEHDVLKLEVTNWLKSIATDQDMTICSWEEAARNYQGTLTNIFASNPSGHAHTVQTDQTQVRQTAWQWHQQQWDAIQARLAQIQSAIASHERHLEQNQQRFLKAYRPGCVQGIEVEIRRRQDLLAERITRLEDKVTHLKAEQGHLNMQLQQTRAHLQQDSPYQEAALGKQAATARWLLYGVFAIGKPGSLHRERAAWDQHIAARTYQVNVEGYRHFLQYSRDFFRLEKQLLISQKNLTVLRQHFQQWDQLLRMLRTNPQAVTQSILIHQARTPGLVVITPLP